MSQRLPWYKRDVDAWRGGTRSMSIELRGFYSELLDAMWDLQGPLPDDPHKIAILICCNARTVRKLLPQLIELRKLIHTPEGLINRRMEAEIIGTATKGIRPEFERNSSGIRREFERKNPKNLMFSTRAKEEEKEEEKDLVSLVKGSARVALPVEGATLRASVKCNRDAFDARRRGNGSGGLQ